MPQVITVQVGQCGNQIGRMFWDAAAREHSIKKALPSPSSSPPPDDATSTFFRLSSRGEVRARAVLVDMEEGVVAETLRGPLGFLFEGSQTLRDVSGSGNNWAAGFHVFGQRHGDALVERLRREAEACDSFQCMLFSLSSGGGTGSGFGSFAVCSLKDQFPKVDAFVTAVLPSEDDDVVTSPYNTLLSVAKLAERADCVIPVSNDALGTICDSVDAFEEKAKLLATARTTNSRVSQQAPLSRPLLSSLSVTRVSFQTKASLGGSQRASSSSSGRGRTSMPPIGDASASGGHRSKPFDRMNSIVARMLIDLTSSARFPGQLNMDLGEVVMNLVPYPRMQFLVSSLAPFPLLRDTSSLRTDAMFRDAFSADHQLLKADPRASTYLACALVTRGNVGMSDLRRNIDRTKESLRFVWWNQDGWKVGHCATPYSGQSCSLLCLANNCCVRGSLETVLARFSRLYRRKAHLHHYLEFMEQGELDHSVQVIHDVVGRYETTDSMLPPAEGCSVRRRALV